MMIVYFRLASDDSPAPEDTATVYYNINLVDEDDVAPVFVNLPYHFELLRSTTSGTLFFFFVFYM